ncbi:ankyrin repeat domain-containing protein 13C isoform X1, partial [Sigmodon hispidus]
HKPNKKDKDVLEPYKEEATAALGGTFTRGKSRASGSGKGKKACHKIFSHHHRLQLKGPVVSSPNTPAPLQHNAVTTTCPAPACLNNNPAAVVTDRGSCPSLYPVHECVFKRDVKRLSSLIRTHNIRQKDNHKNTPLHLAVMLKNKECTHLLLAHNAPIKIKNAQR